MLDDLYDKSNIRTVMPKVIARGCNTRKHSNPQSMSTKSFRWNTEIDNDRSITKIAEIVIQYFADVGFLLMDIINLHAPYEIINQPTR